MRSRALTPSSLTGRTPLISETCSGTPNSAPFRTHAVPFLQKFWQSRKSRASSAGENKSQSWSVQLIDKLWNASNEFFLGCELRDGLLGLNFLFFQTGVEAYGKRYLLSLCPCIDRSNQILHIIFIVSLPTLRL